MVYECNLSADLQKKAQESLHEDPKRRQEDIDRIREWLNKQPHIKARTDDMTILRFLRGCKFSMEKTKTKLDMYYTCRALTPEWFSNRDPLDPKTKEVLALGEFLVLPGYDNYGRKVIVIRAGRHDPSTTSMDEVFKATHMIYDILMDEDEQHTITGISQIIDLQASKGAHVLQMTPALIKKAFTVWQEGYPAMPKAIHYINTPPSFGTVFGIMKTFMKEKMKNRILVHGNSMESLYEHVPKEILPEEYGGTNGTIQDITNDWIEKVNKKRTWLMEDEKYKIDETKRPGKPKTRTDLFGIEGSFRKLNVD